MEERIVIEQLDGDRYVFTDRNCFKYGENIGNYIGGGSSGEVNIICLKDELFSRKGCRHVVKAIDLNDEEINKDDVKREVAMNKVASELKIGPKFIREFQCRVLVSTKGEPSNNHIYQFIISERFDTDLGTFLENHESQESILSLKKCLIMLMKTCFIYWFYHSDIYTSLDGVNEGNIVLNAKNGIVMSARFIDFDGDCKIGADPEKVKKQWCNIFNNLREDHKAFKKYILKDEQVEDICKL